MDVIEFDYPQADGTVQRRRLANWKEVGVYLVGFDVDRRAQRTFFKHRVAAYAPGAAELLAQPHPTAPTLKARKPRDPRPHVLFTGFAAAQRASMESYCVQHDVPVCQDVTASCGFVVTGPNAGPAKLARARAAGKVILTWPQMRHVIDTGELPDDETMLEGLTDC